MKTETNTAASTPASRIPTKWHWHYRALRRLRDHLVDDLCLRIAQAAEPIEPASVDLVDSASQDSERTLAVSLLSGEENAIHEVDSAIQRIRAGRYGICEKTGEPIPLARLRAVPWTRFTKAAEDAIEQERGSGWRG